MHKGSEQWEAMAAVTSVEGGISHAFEKNGFEKESHFRCHENSVLVTKFDSLTLCTCN